MPFDRPGHPKAGGILGPTTTNARFVRPARSHRRAWRLPSLTCFPRAPWSSTSPTRQGSSFPAPPRGRLATTGSATTGGAIGLGLPVATGAAIGAPDRPVICIQADGSAMYTLQALWTQAREGLDVTTVILSNRAYAILNLELSRVGAGAGGPRAERMLELSSPDLDFVALAQGMGVPADAGHHGRGAGRSAATRAARARPTPDRGCPSDRARMTAGVGHDLPTERAQAVVPGQIRRPAPIAATEVGRCHEAPRMGHNMMHNANVDD